MNAMQDNPIRPALLVSGRGLVYYQGFLTHLVQILRQRGGDGQLVICTPEAPENPEVPEVHWVVYPEFDLPLLHGWNIRRLLGQLKSFEPSLIHCIEESSLGLGQNLASALDLNVMVSIQRLQTRRGQLTISNRRCQGLLVPCDSIRASVLRLHPRYRDRVIRVSPWVEEPNPRQARGIDRQGTPTLVVTVQHSRDKGMGLLMRCLHDLRQRGYDFMVAILAEPECEVKIRHWLDQWDLHTSVALVTDLYRWPDVIAAGDALVLPEPLLSYDPRLMEAMRQGLTVIACAGGVEDWLEREKTAWTFTYGDRSALMTALERLWIDPQAADSLGQTCRERMAILARQAHVNAVSWLEVYRQMAMPSTGLEVLV